MWLVKGITQTELVQEETGVLIPLLDDLPSLRRGKLKSVKISSVIPMKSHFCVICGAEIKGKYSGRWVLCRKEQCKKDYRKRLNVVCHENERLRKNGLKKETAETKETSEKTSSDRRTCPICGELLRKGKGRKRRLLCGNKVCKREWINKRMRSKRDVKASLEHFSSVPTISDKKDLHCKICGKSLEKKKGHRR